MIMKKYKVMIGLLLITIFYTIPVYPETFNICIVKDKNVEPYEIALRGCLNALWKKGYKEGKNLVLTHYDLEKDQKKNSLIINKIKKKNPDLIITFGTKASKILKKGIRNIPVVFSMVLNPIKTGLMKKVRGSEDNFTGASMNIVPECQFKILKDLLPQIKKVGVIYNSRKTGDLIKTAGRSAKKYDLELIKKNIFSPKGVPLAINHLIEKIDALWLVADSTVVSNQSLQYILKVALKENIPVIAQAGYVVRMGALISLDCDYEDIGR